MTSVIVTGIGFFMFYVIIVITGDDDGNNSSHLLCYIFAKYAPHLLYKRGRGEGDKMRMRGL